MTEYGYDLAGRLECTAVRMNLSWAATACIPATPGVYGPDRITRTLYDRAGQRVQLRAGVGSSVEGAEASWDYSPNGQVTTVIDGNGNRATLQYDHYGRQSGWTFPSSTPPSSRPVPFDDSTLALTFSTAGAAGTLRELYEYDPNGNRRFLTRRDGARIEYQYDALNRMTVKIVPSRTTGPQALSAAQVRDVYYSYDLRGLQTGARFDSASGDGITNAFDGFGRLSWTSTNMNGTARRLDYEYDPNGNRTRITHPDGHWFDMTWDGLNRPRLLRANGTTTLASTDYYPHGAPWVINRIATATEINYDQVQRPYVLHHYLGGAPDVVWTSQFNTAGQVLSTVRTNDAYAWTRHYGISRPYTTNGLNQYSLVGTAPYTYDDNGNLVSDGSRTWIYDMENRMVGATGGVTLAYDPLGRLFQVSTASTTTRFLYDGDALVAEYNGANQLTRRHVHNVGADVPMVTYDVAEPATLGTITQLYADRQGSIVTLANGSGATTAINTYDEYGIPGVGNLGRFQYTGQIWLAELGLYYYKARIYSPTLGRFMQTDPIGYEDQYNLYAYVGNDPINSADPTGTFRDIYIGGGGDSISGIVSGYAAQQQQLHPDRDIRYFSYSDSWAISMAIAEPLGPGEPLNVIGHSWGGDRALENVSTGLNQVTNLFTIDAVGMQDAGFAEALARKTDNWVNVVATPAAENRNLSDTVASVGRWFGSVPREISSRADRTVSSTQNHGNFRSMMNEANAQEIIDNSYRQDSPRPR